MAAMMMSSHGNIFRVTGHLWGDFTDEFPAQRPVTRSFDVFFDRRLNKQLSYIVRLVIWDAITLMMTSSQYIITILMAYLHTVSSASQLVMAY